VAAGSNGAYLKARVNLPVVLINPTGFDVMHALARARRETEATGSIALVTHGETPAEVRRFVTAYGLDVLFASYQSAQDAQACVLDLRDRGVSALVGPGLVTDLAARAGMEAVFVYSRASVRAAFDTALEVAQAMGAEAVRRQRLDNVLQHLRDGVVALDAQGRVEALNQRLAAMLGIAPSAAVGRAFVELAPDLAASIPDSEGESLASVRGLSYVVHRGPLVDGGTTTGTVLTFQESRAVERLDRTLRSRQRTQQFAARYRLDDLLGECAAIEAVRTLVRRYAKSDATVLIRGESGTGKEMVAQSLHQLSARHDFPFVAINCGAFPEALLESELFGYEEGAFTGARRGGKAGLQEREVVRLGSTEPTRIDVRIVAATHRALTDAVRSGEFRADLYYRLNILNVGLPPLRERRSDIVPLAAALLRDAARREPRLAARIASEQAAARLLEPVREPLVRHTWPGNVRELQNVIERITVELAESSEADSGALASLNAAVLRAIAPELFDVVRPAHGGSDPVDAPEVSPASGVSDTRGAASPPLTLRQRSRRVEADEVRAALEACDGDRDRVCRMLGISKTTLWRKLHASG
jgi:propionate catabolism operon transcriptional regulator